MHCEGNQGVTQRGICWSTDEVPDLNTDPFSVNGEGTGKFTGLMNNLTPGTTYYVVAYAISNDIQYYSETILEIETDE